MKRVAPIADRSTLSPSPQSVSMSTSFGFGLAVFGVLTIGLAALTAAASEVGPTASAFWRLALAVPVLGVLACARPGAWGRIRRLACGPMPPLAGAAFAATLGLWYEGQRLWSVARTSALHNLAPVVVLLVICWRNRSRPRLDHVAGLMLAVVGSGGLATISASISDRALTGDLLATAAAATLALYYMMVARICREAHAWEMMFLVCAFATPLLWVAAKIDATPIAPVTPTGWALVLLLAVSGRVAGQAALAAASRRLGALGTSAVALGEPATAALLAILLIGAPFLPVQFVCIAAVCAGIWMCQSRLPAARPARHPAPTAAE